MSTAFESLGPETTREVRELAATQWAEHSACALYKIIKYHDVDEWTATRLYTSRFDGKKACSLDRWYWWKSKIEKLELITTPS